MEQLTAMIENISVLYNIPLWMVGLVFVVLMLLAEEVGYRVGLVRRAHWGEADGEIGGGGVVLTAMFAILGLIIAFTYSSSVERYEKRKQAVIAEANALGTAFLRANLIAEPGRTELKEALYQYALTRVQTPSSPRIFTPRKSAWLRFTRPCRLLDSSGQLPRISLCRRRIRERLRCRWWPRSMRCWMCIRCASRHFLISCPGR